MKKIFDVIVVFVQEHLVYTAVPMTNSRLSKASSDFIRYLMSAAAKAAFVATGVE